MRLARVISMIAYFAAIVFAGSASAQNLIFSEYIEGSSNNKALEIYNAGETAVNLDSAVVRMYFNGNTSAGLSVTLGGNLAPGDVYVLAHSSADAAILAQADKTSGAGFFNGDDAITLEVGGSVVDSIGQIGFDPGSQWGSGTVSTQDNTLRRKDGVCSGDTNPFDVFDPAVEWDGFANNTFDGLGFHTGCGEGGGGGGDPEPDPVVAAEIFEVQGSGMSSPLVGKLVMLSANVVTAVGPNGFFIQTPDYRADASPETSNGVYVYTGGAPTVSAGDLVDVKGKVAEYFDLTEIGDNPVVTVAGSGQALPASITFDQDTPSHSATQPANEMERFEGMRVSAPLLTAAAATDRFGDTAVVAGTVRPFREAGIEYPGLSGLPVWDGNPEIFEIAPDDLGLSALLVGGGETIRNVEGVLSFSFGDYQIWPVAYEYDGSGPSARPVRTTEAGEMTVGAQNLFRFFDDRDDPTLSEPVSSPEDHAGRLAKFSMYIRNVLKSPDVLAVSEVENLVTLTDLAVRLNADDPSLGYTAYLLEGNDVGGIDVGFLVRSSFVVTSVWQHGKNETQSTNGALLNDRPPLVVEGYETGNGVPFPIAVVAVHQRSLIDVETSDRVRQKRLEQSESLARLAQQLQSERPGGRVIIVGDYNAFEFTDGYVDVLGVVTGNLDPRGALVPGTDMLDPNLSDQVLTVEASDRYSYVENGSAQVLDHAVSSAALQPYIRGTEFTRGNADAPENLVTDYSTPLRASDHDGVVVFIMTDADGDGLPDDVDSCSSGDARATVIIDGCDTGVANPVSGSGCSLTDSILALKNGAKNHGQFVSDLAKMLNGMVKAGELSGAQKGAIQSCAAGSN